MIVNEIMQWAVLAFIGVFVVGLTRQLGMFIVPRVQQIEAAGPQLGKRLPSELVSEAESDVLRQVISEWNAPGIAVVVVDHACAVCQRLVAGIGERGGAERLAQSVGLPFAALVKPSPPEFIEAVQKAFPITLVDGAGEARKAGLAATPFVLVLDEELRVQVSRITVDVVSVAEAWAQTKESEESVQGQGHRTTARTDVDFERLLEGGA